MKKNILFGFLMILVVALSAQNTHNYFKVTAIDTCLNGLSVSGSPTFIEGEKLLLIQSTAGAVDTSDNNNFGNFIDNGFLGNYEVVTVDAVQGNEITLKDSLLNNYDISHSVQLVQGLYNENTLTIDVNPTIQPFDGEKGGVMFLYAPEGIILNTNLSVDGAGYSGAIMNTSSMDCSWILIYDTYGTDENSGIGANKGEGVVSWVPHLKAGRGKWTNAGGGGNDHNSGGGGGAGYGNGGKGGERRIQSNFNCSGMYPGLGGEGLISIYPSNRLLFGGGGGTGHNNNAESTNGGSGGGIIVIVTNRLTADNKVISANGENVSTLAGDDGAAGGGGGGVILFDVNTVIGSVTLNANGGNGGNGAGNATSCAGAGGGGGAGAIYFNTPSVLSGVSTSVIGGSGGLVSTCSVNGPEAFAGEDGAIIYEISARESTKELPAHDAGVNIQACENDVASLNGVGSTTAYWSPGSYVVDSLDLNTSTIVLNESITLFLVDSTACNNTLRRDSVLIEVSPCTSIKPLSEFSPVIQDFESKYEISNLGEVVYIEMYLANGQLIKSEYPNQSVFSVNKYEFSGLGVVFVKFYLKNEVKTIKLGCL